MNKIQVFVSFDTEHDAELYERFLAQSRSSSSSFVVSGGSERSKSADVWSERSHRWIRDADQVIVICGEHTESSMSVSAELCIAREEQTPYFLLWGRREIMCTKPVGAKPAEGMYSWTRQILQDQMVLTLRKINTGADAGIRRNRVRKG